MTKLQQFSHFKIQLIWQTMHHGLCSNTVVNTTHLGSPRFVENLLAIIIFWWSFTTQRCYLDRPNSMVIRGDHPCSAVFPALMVVKFSYRFSLAVTLVGIEPISGGGGRPPLGTPYRDGGCFAACR